MKINFVKDFTNAPGGRYIKDGPKSGELFRLSLLYPNLQFINSEEGLTIDFSDPELLGCPASFLDEIFGKAAESFGKELISKINIIGDRELKETIQAFINEKD